MVSPSSPPVSPHMSEQADTDALSGASVTVNIPIRTVSELNQRERFWARSARARNQKETVILFLRAHLHRIPSLPAHVHITRHSKRKLDSDNLAASQKHVRDAVANFLGVNDGDEKRVTFSYEQRPSPSPLVSITFTHKRQLVPDTK